MKNTHKKKNFHIMNVYIILILMIPVTLYFSANIKKLLDKHIIETLGNSSALCADMLERRYETDMKMLESLAVQLSLSLEDEPELAMERIASFAESYGMKRVAFSYPDGVTLTTDGSEVNMKGGLNFELALDGAHVLSAPIVDRADGELIHVYVIPVYYRDSEEIAGVLASVYNSEIFEDILAASSFEGEGYTYMIDSKGDVVLHSNHANAIVDMENIYEYVAQYDTRASEELKTQLADAENGFFEIEREGRDSLYTYYHKIDVSDWYVVSAVPESVIEETKLAVMNRVGVYCFVIFMGAVIIVLSIRRALKEKNAQLQRALYVDPLTGGHSYEKFCNDCMERLKKEADKNAAFVFLDIDNFNLVATLYGQEESVETIRRMHSILRDTLGEKGIIGRNSADQFCVMYFYDEVEELEMMLDGLVEKIHDNKKFETLLRPSMGIYIVEKRDENISNMLNKARIAHETIKHTGNAAFAYYDTNFRDKKYQNAHMIGEMENALANHEFVPYIQPKYDADTGRICGGEALIRWITPEGRIVPPVQFIPLAENNGFVRELDKEMFMQVCKLQKQLMDQGITPVPISVNVSRQMLYDKSFVELYCNYIRELGIPFDLIELEITESAFFEDIDLFRSTFEKLRDMGFRILMDDFGTGYSSLMMLNNVPIDGIKLDKSFTDEYADKTGSSIIQCVLQLANILNLSVVAEGVETQDQYCYLKDSGCDVIQGYYFSKPVPMEEFLGKIRA